MKKLVIFGTGDIGRLAHFYFSRDAGREVAGFTVDAGHRQAETFLGLPCVDFADASRRFAPAEHDMFVALSYRRMNHLRAERCQAAKEMGFALASYVSSRCTFLSQSPPGENCFILEDNTVQPFVTIGNDVTLWSGNHIGHDSVIEDHCFISSHVVVSGHVTIRPYCFIGVNATLGHSIVVAAETLIGAGAVVTHDTVEKGVYVPARSEQRRITSDQVDL